MTADTAPLLHGRLCTSHVAELCADHLDVPFQQRRALEQTVSLIRTQLAQAKDASQWVFAHLSDLKIRQQLLDGPQPHPAVHSAAFLVQPWTQRWRWAGLPSAASQTPPGDLGACTDAVLAHVAPTSHTQLVRLVADAVDDVLDTHLHLVNVDAEGRSRHRPAVVHARRLGPTDDPLVVGVWLTGTHSPED